MTHMSHYIPITPHLDHCMDYCQYQDATLKEQNYSDIQTFPSVIYPKLTLVD